MTNIHKIKKLLSKLIQLENKLKIIHIKGGKKI